MGGDGGAPPLRQNVSATVCDWIAGAPEDHIPGTDWQTKASKGAPAASGIAGHPKHQVRGTDPRGGRAPRPVGATARLTNMRHLPYIVGGFMLLPFALWLGFELTILPGSTVNLDLPLVAAMTATCLPVLAWFFLVNLGFLAKSIGGLDEFARPKALPVRIAIALLPWISLIGSLASVPFLAAEGYPPLLLALPPVVGAAIFAAIQLGERARAKDRQRLRLKEALESGTRPARGTARKALGGLLLKAFFLVPVIGWLAKDALNGRESAKVYFLVNCIALLVVAVALFGYPVLIVAALTAVPIVFAGLFVLTAA